MPEPPGRFRLGVNYWPARDAMDWLSAYDPVRTRADFADRGGRRTRHRADLPPLGHRPAGAGDDRRAARWATWWMPPTPRPPPVCDLVVTLFTGHMSGVNYAPAWATGGAEGDRRFRVVADGTVQPPGTGLRNWFGDPRDHRCPGPPGDRGGVRPRRTPGRVGVGPRQRELELHGARQRSGGARPGWHA